jgi:hypothetical protein
MNQCPAEPEPHTSSGDLVSLRCSCELLLVIRTVTSSDRFGPVLRKSRTEKVCFPGAWHKFGSDRTRHVTRSTFFKFGRLFSLDCFSDKIIEFPAIFQNINSESAFFPGLVLSQKRVVIESAIAAICNCLRSSGCDRQCDRQFKSGLT